MLENFIISFKEFLYPFAEIAACTLELIGIIIIIVGSFRALIRLVNCLRKKLPFRVVIDLGKALSLALEFKMGAEIIKTVVARDLNELAILGVIIGLRAVLALLIHWEIKTEMKEQELHQMKKEEEKEAKEEK